MLEGVDLFSSLSKEALQTLELFCQVRKVPTGEVLFHKGDESTSMYIVKEGLLEAFDGEKTLGIIHPKEFVGEMSLFDEPKLRTASVKTLQESELIVLLGFSIQELSKKHPEILIEIRKVIENRKKQNQWD